MFDHKVVDYITNEDKWGLSILWHWQHHNCILRIVATVPAFNDFGLDPLAFLMFWVILRYYFSRISAII